MTSIARRHVELDGLRLSYLEAGQGEPVVFVHGWPTNAQLWRHVLPKVGKTHRAIAIDLPGFGASDKPTEQRYSFGFYRRTLDAFFAALDIDRVGLVVHDMGGPIGLYWAVHNAARVRELCMLNTLCFPELSWAVKAFVASTFVPGLKGWLSGPGGVAFSMRFGVTDNSRITSDVAQLYTAPYASDRNARTALLKSAQGMSPRRIAEIEAGLPQFSDIPVRLIYGARDKILPHVAKTMRRVEAILPHADVTAIEDCGHFLQEDRPQQTAQLLAEFFAAQV